MTPGFHATDLVFPVMGLTPEADGTNKPRQVCGTAFGLGGGRFLTAGHVWKEASRSPLQGLGMATMTAGEPETVLLQRVIDAEILETVDIAILKTHHLA